MFWNYYIQGSIGLPCLLIPIAGSYSVHDGLVSKGDYKKPKTLHGSLVAHQPLELLCIDFTKVDVAKGGKENILVLTDAFSKYSQAFITSNQKAITVAKLLVDKWFSVYGIPSRIHSDQGRSFNNENHCSLV